jgi:hypothetical protein
LKNSDAVFLGENYYLMALAIVAAPPRAQVDTPVQPLVAD